MRVYDYVPDGTTIEIKMKVWTGYAGADLDSNAKFSKFSFKVCMIVRVLKQSVLEVHITAQLQVEDLTDATKPAVTPIDPDKWSDGFIYFNATNTKPEIKIGEKIWVDFYVQLPPQSTVDLKVSLLCSHIFFKV